MSLMIGMGWGSDVQVEQLGDLAKNERELLDSSKKKGERRKRRRGSAF
jgi:hypothetical protein